MSFFKKNKEETKPCCCSGNKASEEVKSVSGEIESVKVLGAGCKSCHQMYENTKQAVENAGLGIEVEYITDMEKVMQYGAMSMPALVINEKVVSFGKVLKEKEIVKLFG
ncbi:MAG: thioredoxin family protein [Ruminococcus sp.]|nr:thioredoxin family protein [Ruminococcus sp.]